MSLCCLERLLSVFEALQTKVGDIYCRRSLRTQDGDPGNDSDCSFAPNEQLLDVITSVVLSECQKVIHHGAIRQYSLDA